METLEQPSTKRKPSQTGFQPVRDILPDVLNGIAQRAARWDYFAGLALLGLLAKHGADESEDGVDVDSLVGIAARCADSMTELTHEAGR